MNKGLKERIPNCILIAEDSTNYPGVTKSADSGGLGFDYKWNTDWTKDYLEYIKYDPYFRAHHQEEMTLSMVYAYSEKFIMPFGHDTASEGA